MEECPCVNIVSYTGIYIVPLVHIPLDTRLWKEIRGVLSSLCRCLPPAEGPSLDMHRKHGQVKCSFQGINSSSAAGTGGRSWTVGDW